jgi:hypothetical protein
VYAILMALEAEGNLRLALPAEEDDFFEIRIGTLIRALFRKWKKHLISLLQDCGRLDLVHEAVFALESSTHWTSHRNSILLIFHAATEQHRTFTRY